MFIGAREGLWIALPVLVFFTMPPVMFNCGVVVASVKRIVPVPVFADVTSAVPDMLIMAPLALHCIALPVVAEIIALPEMLIVPAEARYTGLALTFVALTVPPVMFTVPVEALVTACPVAEFPVVSTMALSEMVTVPEPTLYNT